MLQRKFWPKWLFSGMVAKGRQRSPRVSKVQGGPQGWVRWVITNVPVWFSQGSNSKKQLLDQVMIYLLPSEVNCVYTNITLTSHAFPLAFDPFPKILGSQTSHWPLTLLVLQNADNNRKQLKLLMPIKCILPNSTSSTACNPGLDASIGAPEPTAANILCPPPPVPAWRFPANSRTHARQGPVRGWLTNWYYCYISCWPSFWTL